MSSPYEQSIYRDTIYYKPSVYAHAMTGLLIFIGAIIVIQNYQVLSNDAVHTQLTLLLLFGILIGIHGLLHLGLEYMYNYNPLKTFITYF